MSNITGITTKNGEIIIDLEKNRKYYRDWYQKNIENHRERRRKYLKEYRKKTNHKHQIAYAERWPEKDKARQALNRAIRNGEIKRLPCEVCGEKKSHAHHDDYSKPLEVRFFCPLHHSHHHLKIVQE